ncbi:MAG: rRNA maturation RNase YbeY [Clostridium sp. 26_21]|nr:MAG: rRNA maturation RNase YbeY [Clostridium sp. 26_21]
MYQLEYLDLEENNAYEKIIKKVIEQCFKEEKIEESKLYISITLTTPQNIHKINKQYRNVDNETDVLSFPIFEKKELDEKIKTKKFEYEDILGDIVISIDRVKEQAKEYGHSFEREFAYMLVHGFYHLMGYDHIKEEDKAIMRPKEEKVLKRLGITREEMNEK